MTACILQYNFADLSCSVNSTGDFNSLEITNNPQVPVSDESCCAENYKDGRFDVLLTKEWNGAAARGLFRYVFQNPESKVLPGYYRFLAQLNTDRASKRRPPQQLETMKQPFDEAKFNFSKARPEETILQILPWWSSNSNVSSNSPAALAGHAAAAAPVVISDHKLLINVSPVEYGNVLIVPSLSLNLPQVLDLESLRIGVELMLLSRSKNFRVGFNSLCAYASVNHLHMHGYYLNHRLYLETAKLRLVQGSCFEIVDYPAPGFAFVLSDLTSETQLTDFVSDVFKMVQHFQVHEIPHNLYMTRGSAKSNQGQFDAIRVFIWARTPSHGAKICDAFTPAICELAGHLPMKTQEGFENVTEDFVINELRSITVSTFNQVRPQVVQLFSPISSPAMT